MSAIKIDIPSDDIWLLQRLVAMASSRLVNATDDASTRSSLLRLLFGLQRLPALSPGLCVSLGNGLVYVTLNSERFELASYTDDGHTEFCLQYFSGSNHCLQWNDFLIGDDKRNAIELRINSLEETFTQDERLSVEDYSKSGYVDEPPLGQYRENSLSYEQT